MPTTARTDATGDADLYSGHVIDALKELGTPNGQILPSEITPLSRSMRILGPAFTVEGRMNPNAERHRTIASILTMFGAIPEGHVVVYQTNDLEFAHFGDMAATALQARGAIGAIIDGACRDVSKLLQMNLPVFARDVIPHDQFGGWEIVAYNEPIEIGRVHIATGDHVVGDADGVVVVPAAARTEVLKLASQNAAREQEIKQEMLSGTPPLEIFRRRGVIP